MFELDDFAIAQPLQRLTYYAKNTDLIFYIAQSLTNEFLIL